MAMLHSSNFLGVLEQPMCLYLALMFTLCDESRLECRNS